MSEFTNTQAMEYINDIQNPDPNFPYLPPAMVCQPIIDYISLQFHDPTVTSPLTVVPEDQTFGIFNINIRGEIPMTKKHLHIYYTIDCSGSMSDICGDGRTKMQHILHTLENMLRIFHSKKRSKISVHVETFDNMTYTIIKDVEMISEADIEALVSRIKSIHPGGSTNIELALKRASTHLNSYHKDHPDHKLIHLFLTDGEITDGNQEIQSLQAMVPDNCTNIFMGYGISHDSKILTKLAATNKVNQYKFVDALESAGLVYGEIVHGLLYPAIEDVTLVCQDAEIYDYQTNMWLTELYIGDLLCEQTKTYNIRSTHTENASVKVLGKTIVQTAQYQILTDEIESQYEVHAMGILSKGNLTHAMFRQRTQELLYESRQLLENTNNSHSFNLNFRQIAASTQIDGEYDKIKSEKSKMKQVLKDFHKLLSDYIQENKLEDDRFLKTLCDDIYIANKTLSQSENIARMCIAARQTSQGRQENYSCRSAGLENEEDLLSPNPVNICHMTPRIGRCGPSRSTSDMGINSHNSASRGNWHRNVADDDINNYTLSQNVLSPYASDGVVSIMRDVSGDHSLDVNSLSPSITINMDEDTN